MPKDKDKGKTNKTAKQGLSDIEPEVFVEQFVDNYAGVLRTFNERMELEGIQTNTPGNIASGIAMGVILTVYELKRWGVMG